MKWMTLIPIGVVGVVLATLATPSCDETPDHPKPIFIEGFGLSIVNHLDLSDCALDDGPTCDTILPILQGMERPERIIQHIGERCRANESQYCALLTNLLKRSIIKNAAAS